MIDFEALSTAATIGTRVRSPQAADLPEAIAAVVAASDPTAVVLEAASAWAAARSASVDPGPELPEVRLPPPSRPCADPSVVALLRQIRADATIRDPLQHEVLTALAARGLTLPADLLLELLADVHRPEVARDLAAVLDARAWALVALDEDWSRELARAGAASEPADPRIWDEGSLPQRVEHLKRLRATDPEAARSLLEGPAFAKEPPNAREALIAGLETGLSAADEPFLEAQLDDRAKGVRNVAAILLMRLPDSAYIARAVALARHHLQLRRRLLQAPVLVAEPVPVTEQTRRDHYNGSDQKVRTTVGVTSVTTPPERSQLMHLLILVPTHRWTEVVGASAVELVSAAAEYDGSAFDVVPFLAVAARRWRNAGLAEAIVARDPSRLPDLLGVLPAARREQLLVAALASGTAARLLEQVVAQPMSQRLAVAALDAIRRLAEGKPQLQLIGQLVVPLALNADVSAAPALVDGLRALDQRLPQDNATERRESAHARREAGRAAAALQLRQALAEALAPYPAPTTSAPTTPSNAHPGDSF